MKKAIGIAITDEISRNNTKLTIGGLTKGYIDSWHTGVPMGYNHDRTKVFGWTSLLSLFFEPDLTKLTNISLFPETEGEHKRIQNRINAYQIEQYSKEETNFNILIDKVKGYLSADYKKFLNGCICIYDKNIVGKVFIDLLEEIDDDGLIEISKLKELMPGVYEKEGFVIFAHSYFRRSLSRLNVLNEPFLELFSSVSKLDNVCAKIALDFDVIGLLGTQRRTMEFQYWWGPKFRDTFSDIEYGVTLHKNENYNTFLNPLLQTEFWWYRQDGKNTFECEEMIDVANINSELEMYGCRFVHSMIDSLTDSPVHLDGAIRAYTDEKMLARLEQKISETDRDTEYTKLWRLDGQIPAAKWKELITHYYRDNKLVGEYFGGKDNIELSEPIVISNEMLDPVKKRVPYSINEGDGLRLSIRYKEKEGYDTEYDVLVRTNQAYFKNDNFSKYINSEFTTLYKLIKLKGINIREPSNAVKRIAFNDTVINFPILLSRGENSVQNANVMLECIKTICNLWIANGNDTIVTFSIEIEYENNNILFSYAGHVKDIVTWLNNKNSKIPTSSENIVSWCEIFSGFLYSYPASNNQPETFELLNEDGTLCFKRVFVENEMIKDTSVDEKGLLATIAIPKNDSGLIEALTTGKLTLTAASHVKQSLCSKCSREYRQCSCIKGLDDSVEIMKDIEGVGLFWTNRMA